jgi:hypothetical protein
MAVQSLYGRPRACMNTALVFPDATASGMGVSGGRFGGLKGVWSQQPRARSATRQQRNYLILDSNALGNRAIASALLISLQFIDR